MKNLFSLVADKDWIEDLTYKFMRSETLTLYYTANIYDQITMEL